MYGPFLYKKEGICCRLRIIYSGELVEDSGFTETLSQ
jgi:hypothetical protein